MRILLQPAFVLHHRPYRETSLILELFTEDHGRIALVAKGIRTQRSTLKSLLQPFTPILVSWQGKSDLMAFITAEPNGVPFHLRGDCLLSGFYLNELMLRLLQKQDPHPELYRVYQKTLVELHTLDFPEIALRIFEKKFLEEMGYGLQMHFEHEKFYQYIPEQGLVLCEDDFTGAFLGKNLLAFAHEQFEKENLAEAKRLMRMMVAELLEGKPLESRKLFY